MGLHGALSLKMSTPMTEMDYLANFYYKTNFSNQTIKKQPKFCGKINIKKNLKIKKIKNVGGLRNVHMTRP